jgi:hypothetical protein
VRLTARAAALLGTLAAIGACAAPMPPPGGPPDTKPAVLLKVQPESGAVNVKTRAVIFTFDEVIAERPSGAASLAGIVLFSPQSGEPDVAWSRNQIYVRPGRGWRPDAVYSITLLPGVTDLRNNVLKKSTTIVFSTGGSIPDTKISGVAFDWVKGTPAVNGLIEAIRKKDSTVYVALSDSTGRFTVRNVPPDTYVIRAVVDANNNRKRDPREPWDSTLVTLADSASTELYAFVHDTLGPRLSTLQVRDSLTLRLTFDQPLLPSQTFSPTNFLLRAADSTVLGIKSVRTAAVADSLEKIALAAAAKARADSLAKSDTGKKSDSTLAKVMAAARRDSIARHDSIVRRDSLAHRDSLAALDTGAAKRLPPPKMNRTSPPVDLVLQLEAPLKPLSSYRLKIDGLIGLLGASRTSERAFVTAKAKSDTSSAAKDAPRRRPRPGDPPPKTRGAPGDTLKVPKDSVKTPAAARDTLKALKDSVKTPRDSTKPPAPAPAPKPAKDSLPARRDTLVTAVTLVTR